MVSAIDDVNVRRAVLEIQKNISDHMQAYVFEVSDEHTENEIKKSVQAYLNHINEKSDMTSSISYSKVITAKDKLDKMDDGDKVVYKLEQEIKKTKEDVIELTVELQIAKPVETIHLNFKV